MIRTKNYVTNTLRKQRTQAFEKDIKELYDQYAEMKIPPHLIVIREFYLLWEKCHMQFIFQCIGEQEDEEEFVQHLYQIFLKKYFLGRPKHQKIFTIFSLYSAYFVCQRRKKILLSKPYIDELIEFMRQNSMEGKCDYMKLIRYLHENCFSYCTKVGLRTPIFKSNGETVKKPPIISSDSLEFISVLKEQLASLKADLSQYQAVKQEAKSLGLKTQKLKLTDVYFSHRVDQLVQQFEKDVEVSQQL